MNIFKFAAIINPVNEVETLGTAFLKAFTHNLASDKRKYMARDAAMLYDMLKGYIQYMSPRQVKTGKYSVDEYLTALNFTEPNSITAFFNNEDYDTIVSRFGFGDFMKFSTDPTYQHVIKDTHNNVSTDKKRVMPNATGGTKDRHTYHKYDDMIPEKVSLDNLDMTSVPESYVMIAYERYGNEEPFAYVFNFDTTAVRKQDIEKYKKDMLKDAVRTDYYETSNKNIRHIDVRVLTAKAFNNGQGRKLHKLIANKKW